MHPSWCIIHCQFNPIIKQFALSFVPKAAKAGSSSSPGPSSSPAKASQGSPLSAQLCDRKHKDCLFREFRKLCAMVADKNSYNVKTQIIETFLKKGSGGGWCD